MRLKSQIIIIFKTTVTAVSATFALSGNFRSIYFLPINGDNSLKNLAAGRYTPL